MGSTALLRCPLDAPGNLSHVDWFVVSARAQRAGVEVEALPPGGPSTLASLSPLPRSTRRSERPSSMCARARARANRASTNTASASRAQGPLWPWLKLALTMSESSYVRAGAPDHRSTASSSESTVSVPPCSCLGGAVGHRPGSEAPAHFLSLVEAPEEPTIQISSKGISVYSQEPQEVSCAWVPGGKWVEGEAGAQWISRRLTHTLSSQVATCMGRNGYPLPQVVWYKNRQALKEEKNREWSLLLGPPCLSL